MNIDAQQATNLIKTTLDLDFQLINSTYHYFSTSTAWLLMLSHETILDNGLAGTPLVYVGNNHTRIYPSILDVIDTRSVATYEMTDISKLQQVSKGRSVLLELTSSPVIITDHTGEIIAIGRSDQGYFHPIIDKGMYLRIEDEIEEVEITAMLKLHQTDLGHP